MNEFDRRWLLAGVGLVGVAALSRTARGGPLSPPVGSVGSTGKTLTEIEPRIALSAANTPGDSEGHYCIQQPGSYYLTENLSIASKAVIKVLADNVTIDLNGFQIANSATTRPAILSTVATNDTSSLVIRNGIIGNAAVVNSVAKSITSNHAITSIEGVTFSRYAVIAGRRIVASSCAFFRTGSTGPTLAGTRVELDSCVLEGNFVHAAPTEFLRASHCRFKQGSISGPVGMAFDACDFDNCQVQVASAAVPLPSIVFDGCTFTNGAWLNGFYAAVTALRCLFNRANLYGRGVTISDCSFVDATAVSPFGITTYNGGTVERTNIKGGATGGGIYTEGALIVQNCVVRGCTISDPGSAAITLRGGGHRITHNIIDNNTRGILMTSAVTTPTFIANNTVTRNPGGNFVNTGSHLATTFTSVQAINEAAVPSPFANLSDGP